MADVQDDQSLNTINITPLVDVSLVLLLIFMVAMPLSLINAINIKSQVLQKYGLSTPQENILVHLTDHGVFIKDEKGKMQPIPYTHFGMVLTQMIQVSSTKNLLLQVDRDVPHGQTVWVLDIGKQNGAKDVSLFEGA